MLTAETSRKITIAANAGPRLAGVSVFGRHLKLVRNAEPEIDLLPHWTALHQIWRGRSRKEVELHSNVQAYEAFYRQMGLDPTRNPPSVKGLVTRFLRGEELTRVPAIHPIVDAVNVAAVQSMIPLGVFDSDTVEGEICIDIPLEGEPFTPIGGDGTTALDPGMVVLRDEHKILSIFCSRDGEAQKVTTATSSVWMLGCQVPGIDVWQIESAITAAIELLRRNYAVKTLE